MYEICLVDYNEIFEKNILIPRETKLFVPDFPLCWCEPLYTNIFQIENENVLLIIKNCASPLIMQPTCTSISFIFKEIISANITTWLYRWTVIRFSNYPPGFRCGRLLESTIIVLFSFVLRIVMVYISFTFFSTYAAVIVSH